MFHTGQVLGYEAMYAYFPGSGATLAFLINSDGTGSDVADPTNTLFEAVLPLVLETTSAASAGN